MRRWIKLAVGLPVALSLLAWPWVSGALDAGDGDRFFRQDYEAGRDGHISMSDYQWAAAFGGHAGLSRLQILAEDRSLVHGGRKVAADACLYVANGGYRRELQRLVDETPVLESPKWAMRWRYLYYRELLLGLTY